jgi:iron complex outermembrane receptor protein
LVKTLILTATLVAGLLGTCAAAQDPATQATQTLVPPAKLTSSEQVTVILEGETRDVQSVSSKLMLEAAPGTSPIAVLGRLPSVSITSADPYGAYEWAVRISIRGFGQNQLGFTLDDVPLGDMSYGNLNGLHISRALIDENMGYNTGVSLRRRIRRLTMRRVS